MTFLEAFRLVVTRFVPVNGLDDEAIRVLRRALTLWDGQ